MLKESNVIWDTVVTSVPKRTRDGSEEEPKVLISKGRSQ